MAGTYTNLLYHLVFSTKGPISARYSRAATGVVCLRWRQCRGDGGVLVEVGGMPDHVHLLAKFKPRAALAEMLRLVKGSSSKWVNEEKIKARKFGWQDGYGAFSVSESQVDAVREYIRTQETHHRGLSYQDEFRALLDRHGIEYDELYLWD
jgi:putative transposase